MIKKLFIRVWIGPLPKYICEWYEHCAYLKQYGWDFMVVNDHDLVKQLCKEKLGVDINIPAGTRKAGDFDPFYGVIFEDYIKGYDFWGHTNLDMVYGRLDRYMTDEFLSDCDIFGNDPNAICGPFSLYRNTPVVNNLFRDYDGWEAVLEETAVRPAYGFDEIQFTEVVRKAHAEGRIRFKSAFWQSNDVPMFHRPPKIRLLADGTLIDSVKGEETMMFHFNRTQAWPSLSRAGRVV